MPNVKTATLADEVIGDSHTLLSVKAAAERAGIAYFSMLELFNKGVIPSVYQGTRRYCTVAAYKAYIESLTGEPG